MNLNFRMQYHFYLALGMRLEVAGQRGTAVSFPPLWQWQSRWDRRKFREDEVFMWLLVIYNEKMRGNGLRWSCCGWCIWV